MHENSVQTSGSLDLGEVLVISDVLEWHKKVIALLDGSEELILDGSRIEQIDAIGLQLLVAAIKQAADQGVQVTWMGASDTLVDNAAQLDLLQLLHFDVLDANG